MCFSCRTLVWCLHGFSLFLYSALYGCFCLLTCIFQNEVRITLNVEKSNLSLFRIILRYINPGGETLSGRISTSQSWPEPGRCNSTARQMRWMLDQRSLFKVHPSQICNVTSNASLLTVSVLLCFSWYVLLCNWCGCVCMRPLLTVVINICFFKCLPNSVLSVLHLEALNCVFYEAFKDGITALVLV